MHSVGERNCTGLLTSGKIIKNKDCATNMISTWCQSKLRHKLVRLATHLEQFREEKNRILTVRYGFIDLGEKQTSSQLFADRNLCYNQMQ